MTKQGKEQVPLCTTNSGVVIRANSNPTIIVINATAIAGVTPPAPGATPVTSVTAGTGYTGTVTWLPVHATFASATVYTATITLLPTAGYTLTGVSADQFTIAGTTSATNPINSGVITAVFPETDTTIAAAAINGVTVPVKSETPVSSLPDGVEYSATILWSPTHNPFNSATVYTATITLTPKPSYTLAGVLADSFAVAGATATNPINSGVITAVFPETAAFVCGDLVTGLDLLTYYTVTGADTRCWFDRNLGATQVATAFDDYLAYGSLFQWGRATDGHQLINHTDATNATGGGSTFTLATSDTPGDALFIKNIGTAPDTSRDWKTNATQNDALWQGESGANNPCPSGFRLPTATEWTTLMNVVGSLITDSATAFSSTLKLTVAGYRGGNSASLFTLGSGGSYWSSDVIGAYSSGLYFNASAASVETAYRAAGLTVRCLKDLAL